MAKRRKTVNLLFFVINLFTLSAVNGDVQKVFRVEPNRGSLNGATSLTIFGSGFSMDQLNQGNVVTLVSDTKNYDCAVNKDSTTQVQIQCDTEPMDAGDYYVRVQVDGQPIPLQDYCQGNAFRYNCRFTPMLANTPIITDITPRSQSGPPGQFIEIHGKIMSGVYGSNVPSTSIENGVPEPILRVYVAYQMCELKNTETDELYGITLYNDGLSKEGFLKCLMTGTFIGSSSASIIVDGQYGRTMPDLMTLKVSSADQIYMFQTYAEITDIYPKTGSIKGGLMLSIAGKNFDQNVKIMVGDTSCTAQSVTPQLIVCMTAPQSSMTRYPGNRGIMLELWNETSKTLSDLPQVSDFTGSESDYSIRHVDDFYIDDTAEEAVYRMRGFVVPPHDGEYAFLVKGNKGTKLYLSHGTADNTDPANKVEIISKSGPTSSFQTSSRITLQKGKYYYIEALHQVDSGPAKLQVALKHYNTEFLHTDTGFANPERHKLKFTSQIVREVQRVTVAGFTENLPVFEVQKVRITEAVPSSDATYQLKMYGVYTEPLTTSSDKATIEMKLMDLPFLESSESVMVDVTSISGGVELTITFNSTRGQFPLFEYKTTPGSDQSDLTVVVSRMTLGVPSGQYVALFHEGVPAPLFTPTATASQVQIALDKMYGTRCSKKLKSPAGRRKFYDYETSKPDLVGGSLTNKVEPFCGRSVIMNPSYLFRDLTADSKGLLLTTSLFMVCFAYQGSQLQNRIRLGYTYEDLEGQFTTSLYDVPVEFNTNEGWHYHCLDMRDALNTRHTTGGQPAAVNFYIMYIQVYKMGTVLEFFIDDVLLGRGPPVDIEDIHDYRMLPSKPNGALIDSISVTSSSSGVYDITLVPHDCGNDFPLYEPGVGQIITGGTVTVVRTATASPPLTGTFTLTFDGTTTPGLPFDMDESLVAAELQVLPGVGNVEVKRYGGCADFDYTITYLTLPGDIDLIQIDGSNINGVQVSVTSETMEDGALRYDPIPGDILRTYHTEPQVSVEVNGVPSHCNSNCGFNWAVDQTPTLATKTPFTGTPGTELTLTGTGFDTTPANNEIYIGDIECVPIQVNNDGTSMTCTSGLGPRGLGVVKLRVIGKGYATGPNLMHIYVMLLEDFSPTTVSLGGGILLTANGKGFDKEDIVVTIGVDKKLCQVKESSSEQVKCVLPAMPAGNHDLTINTAGTSKTYVPKLTYDAGITPTINSVTPATENAAGGSMMTITGSGFGSSGTLFIGETEAEATFTDTEITATLPPISAGTYPVYVFSGNTGAAVNSAGEVPTITYMLSVTNVFPLTGSLYGGTRVTVTGDGFSNDVNDTEVLIGDITCDVETTEPTQIVCLIQDTGNSVEINNQGVHPIWGKGYQWEPIVAMATEGDIIRWTWTTPPYYLDFRPSVIQTVNATTMEGPTDGFVTDPRPNGVFEYKVTQTGTYYYSSGFIDSNEIIIYSGTIEVKTKDDFTGNVTVKVKGFEAVYQVDSGVSDPSPPAACGETTSELTACALASPTGGAGDRFSFRFQTCSTPIVSSISINEGTTEDTINIDGDGFSTVNCQNEVMIGNDVCNVQTSSETQLVCSLNAADFPTVGRRQTVNVRVSNRGTALITETGQNARTFVLIPAITDVSPTDISVNGGALLVIKGSGFQGDMSSITVYVDRQANMLGINKCDIQSVTYIEITCTTPQLLAGSKLVEVLVMIEGNTVGAECKMSPNCEIQYSQASTPDFTGVSPTSLDGSSTTVTVTGNGFGSDTAQIMVTIGGVDCVVSSTTEQQITCDITNIPAGTQDIIVTNKVKGHATNTNDINITGQSLITNISPTEGSIYGGTILEITGNGFTNDTSVSVDGATCKIVSVTLSLVKCETPAHSATTGASVNVMANGQSYPQQTFDYVATASPTVTSVTFPSGGIIYVNGNYFSDTPSDVTVMVGSADCTVTSATTNGIQCSAPVLPVGPHNVVVHIMGKGMSNSDKTVTYVLTLTSISPNTGSVGGGQTVTLSGLGFDNTTTATVCSQECMKIDTASQTASQLICSVPPASGSVAGTLSCNVEVSANSQTGSLTSAYTYDSSLTSSISSVSPRRGGTGGGTTISVTGMGFGTVVNDVSVTIGGTPCVVTSVTNIEIVCTSGPHSPSEMTSVRVEIGGNGIAVETEAGSSDFHYVDVWSSPYTWGGDAPPENGTLVVIQKGQTIVLDTNTAKLKMLLIKGGSLIFDDKDLELTADYILITEGGLLQVGTEDEPFQNNAIITMTGHVRSKELPVYGTKGIGVREGILQLHGKPINQVWTKLAETAMSGTKEIKVLHPVKTGSGDWKPNDKIVIASTGIANSVRENEEHEIDSISGDGVTITLKDQLVYTHLGTSETVGSRTLEYRAEVGLLTRNVLFRGSRDQQWEDEIDDCPNGFNVGEFATQTCFQGRFGEGIGSNQFGAQIMLHPAVPDQNMAIGKISFIEFNYVGQAFRLGRYPFHTHLAGVANESYIKGCAIHESFNRAVNIHGTHNVLVENNVAFNIMGGAFFLEDGIETGNIFRRNFLSKVIQSSSLQTDDTAPAGIWATNPSNFIEDNAVSGGTHFGYWYRLESNPRGPSATTSINPRNGLMGPGIGTFTGNTAHSQGWFGLWIFEDYFPRDNGLSSGGTTEAVFENFYAWNCDKGAELVNGGEVQFKNFRLVNNNAGMEIKMLKEGEFYTTTGPLIADSFIYGSSSAAGSKSSTFGIVVPLANRLLIDNVEFHEFNGAGSAVFSIAQITGTSGPNNGGFTYHTRNLAFTSVGSTNKGKFNWEFNGLFKDEDGSLIGDSGKNGWWVVPQSNIFPSTCQSFPGFSLQYPAVICPQAVKFIRFSFNNAKPSSLEYKTLQIKLGANMATSPWEKKRVTHKKGYMVDLPCQQTYDFSFENAEQLTNISFTGKFYLMEDGDWIILRTKVAQKPDCVVQDSVCVNETEGALDGASHYFGDWSYSPNDGMISYLVSTRDRNDRKKRAISNSNMEIDLNYKLYKCLYKDCIVPEPGTVPLTDVRPDDAVFWSNPNSWPNNTVPQAGDCVTIEEGVWMVANTTIPEMCELILHGVLELEASDGNGGYNSFEIKTPYIIISKTGRLIAGFNEEQPFQGNLHIILQGRHSTPNYILQPDDRALGSKIIGVFGGLDLNGRQPSHSWTKLAATANIGDSTLTVSHEVDWIVGNEIVVTPTGYNAWEAETFRLTAVNVSGGQTVLTLNDTLQYNHLSMEMTVGSKMYPVVAEVGLLSRNIIVEGEDYDDMFKESFGGSIIVGVSSTGKGRARISNVEFKHMGQEGYVDSYDPRYAIAFVDTGAVTANQPSYVISSAFHNGFAPAIGVYNLRDLKIEDNVIHHTVYWAIETMSTNTQLRRNVVTLNIFPGTYQDRFETSNVDHDGAISAMKSTGLVLEDNYVSGGERACYRVPPDACDVGSSLYTGNIARTCLMGVAVLPFDRLTGECRKFSGFTLVKSLYFGIYYNNVPSLEIENVIVGDSPVGVFPMVIGPSATGHAFADKYVSIKTSLIIGKSSAFDCTTDILDMADDNIKSASTSRPSEINRRIGIVTGQFTSGSNNCPEKPCINIMSYQAIKGLTTIEDVIFSGFTNECSQSGAAIASNKNNDDGQHPVTVTGLQFDGTPLNNRVFYHRPNLGKINPSDCVDMDCDGLKKNLIQSLDGSLFGSTGAVIPQSEYEWDGNPARGLGDYRIPKTMLTTTTGIRIDADVLALYKGVIRNDSCTYQESWQAYECPYKEYRMLIIESMDADTETRRISPVAILGHDNAGNGYVDLINGPQDHGWCSGYTCRKRLSTFQALVELGRHYEVQFTGTTPQNMRYFLLNSDNADSVTASVWYSQPFRLDVYYDGSFVMPENGEWKNIDGNQIYNLKPTTTLNQYVPSVTDPAGSNWFDRDTGLLYFTMRDSKPLEVKTVLAVLISFKYPPVSIDEFYGERVVEYIAEFFDLPPEKVRIANIISESSTGRRRKRAVDGDVLVIEISNEPSYEVNGTIPNPLTMEDLLRIYDLAVDEGQLGNFSYIVDGQLIGVSVAKPISPDDPNWATIDVNTEGGSYRILVQVDELVLHQRITPNFEGLPFTVQPKIKVYDTYGNKISELGTEEYPWSVTATLRGGNPSAELIGNTTVQFVDGWANFTNLGINYFGSNYIIDFNISSPSQGENYTVASNPITIPARQIHAVIVETPEEMQEQSPISITLELRDTVTGGVIEDIQWRNHQWKVVASLGRLELYDVAISGSGQISFDPANSRATFSNIQLSTYGMFVLKYHVTSNPPDYDFFVEQTVRVRGQQHIAMEANEMSKIKLRFSDNYGTVVGNEKQYFIAYLTTWFGHMYPNIEVLEASVTSGSIIYVMTVSGNTSTINETLYSVCTMVTNDTSGLAFNGHELTWTKYVTYNGNSFYGGSCVKDPDDDDDKFLIPIIIACSMIGLALLVIIIFVILWKCKVHAKTKISDSRQGSYYGDIDDILFREKSFMSVSSSGGRIAPISTHLQKSNGYYKRKTPDIFE